MRGHPRRGLKPPRMPGRPSVERGPGLAFATDDKLARRLHAAIEFREADAEHLPFADGDVAE